jgi:hypothetical protein
MSDTSPTKSPFPAGFERDAKTIFLGFDMKIIPLHVAVHNLKRLGVEWPEAPAPRQAPALERPSVEYPTFEPEFETFADDPDHAYEVHTGAVYNVHTGVHVGFIDLEGEATDVVEMMIPEGEHLAEPTMEIEADEQEIIGPPPPGAEFEDPEFDGDGVAIERPRPEDDEQIRTEVPE